MKHLSVGTIVLFLTLPLTVFSQSGNIDTTDGEPVVEDLVEDEVENIDDALSFADRIKQQNEELVKMKKILPDDSVGAEDSENGNGGELVDVILEEKPEPARVIIPLVLENIVEEPELCEDGEEKLEPGTACDDEDVYTEDDSITDDGCTCEGEVPPIDISYSPSAIIYNRAGLPLLSSVRSVDVVGGGAPYCSMIARLNLKQFFPNRQYITGIGSHTSIALGDAVTLIKNGVSKDLLTQVLARDMNLVLENSGQTVVDLYLYSPKGYSIDSEKWYLQGHRAVVFKADDGQRYVLDPLRGSANITPQVLREYLYHYSNKNAEFYIHTQLLYPENSYEIDEDGILIDAACEIELHTSNSTSMSHEGTLFQSEKVCFDIVDMCS